jgi:hypothetical protein
MQKILTRFFLISSILLLFSMVYYKFYFDEPKGELTDGVLILVGLLVFLVVAEYFDHFTLEIMRHQKIHFKEKNKMILENQFETNQLLKKLLESYKSSLDMTQRIRPIAKLNMAKVIKSSLTNIEEDYYLIHPKLQNEAQLKSLKSFILSKYLLGNQFSDKNLIKNVEIDIPNNTIDPIGNMNPVFDGYIETETEALFISLGFLDSITTCFYERLYVQLARLHWYQKCKPKRILYKVIFVDFSMNDATQKDTIIDANYYASFLPSIKSGLLTFEYTSVLDQEVLQVIKPIFNT